MRRSCVVQLRSNPPQHDDDGRSYYELLVRRGGEIALTRYRKENGNARQQITATVTREVLLRLGGRFLRGAGLMHHDVRPSTQRIGSAICLRTKNS